MRQWLACALFAGCVRPAAGGAVRPASLPEPEDVPANAPRYSYVFAGDLASAHVEARLPSGAAGRAAVYAVRPDVAGMTSLVSIDGAAGATWPVVRCARPSGCVVRYRLDLGAALRADQGADLVDGWSSGGGRGADGAGRAGSGTGGIVLATSRWLLRPVVPPGSEPKLRYVLRVEGEKDASGRPRLSLESGLEGATGSGFEGSWTSLDRSPYTAVGDYVTRAIPTGRSTVALAVPRPLAAKADVLAAWVARSAAPIVGVTGEFPVPRLLVVIQPVPGRDVVQGFTMGNEGASIVVEVGRDLDPEKLAPEWVLTHEMMHLTIPSVERRYRWFEEGLATYLEPVAQARAGTVTKVSLWHDIAAGLPLADAAPGERGLDAPASVTRTYWAGALSFLLADILMRARSHGAFGLPSAVRAVHEAGADIRGVSSLDALIRTMDGAAGSPVLAELHARFATEAVAYDRAALLAKLGVVWDGTTASLRDDAPWSKLRRAIEGSDPDGVFDPSSLPGMDRVADLVR